MRFSRLLVVSLGLLFVSNGLRPMDIKKFKEILDRAQTELRFLDVLDSINVSDQGAGDYLQMVLNRLATFPGLRSNLKPVIDVMLDLSTINAAAPNADTAVNAIAERVSKTRSAVFSGRLGTTVQAKISQKRNQIALAKAKAPLKPAIPVKYGTIYKRLAEITDENIVYESDDELQNLLDNAQLLKQEIKTDIPDIKRAEKIIRQQIDKPKQIVIKIDIRQDPDYKNLIDFSNQIETIQEVVPLESLLSQYDALLAKIARRAFTTNEMPTEIEQIKERIFKRLDALVRQKGQKFSIEDSFEAKEFLNAMQNPTDYEKIIRRYKALEDLFGSGKFSPIPDSFTQVYKKALSDKEATQKGKPGEKQDITVSPQAIAVVNAINKKPYDYDAIITAYETLKAATQTTGFQEQFEGLIPANYTKAYNAAKKAQSDAQKLPPLDISLFIDQNAVTDFGDALLQFVKDIKKIVDDNHLYQGILRNLYKNLNILAIINDAQIPGIPKIQLTTVTLTGTRNEALEQFVNSSEVKNLGTKLTNFVTKVSGQTNKDNVFTLLTNLRLIDITSLLFPEIKIGNKNPAPLRRMNRR